MQDLKASNGGRTHEYFIFWWFPVNCVKMLTTLICCCEWLVSIVELTKPGYTYRLPRRHPRFWFLWNLKHGKECDWKLSRMWRTLSLFLPPDPLCCLLRALLRVIIWALPNQHLACKIPLSFSWTTFVQFKHFLVFKLLQSSRVRVTRSKIRESCWWNSLPMFDCLPKIWNSSLCVVQIVQSRKQLCKLEGHLYSF